MTGALDLDAERQKGKESQKGHGRMLRKYEGQFEQEV